MKTKQINLFQIHVTESESGASKQARCYSPGFLCERILATADGKGEYALSDAGGRNLQGTIHSVSYCEPPLGGTTHSLSYADFRNKNSPRRLTLVETQAIFTLT